MARRSPKNPVWGILTEASAAPDEVDEADPEEVEDPEPELDVPDELVLLVEDELLGPPEMLPPVAVPETESYG